MRLTEVLPTLLCSMVSRKCLERSIVSGLRYKVRGDSPQGKTRVYFCCHKDDFSKYFNQISEEILRLQPCALWYREENSVFDDEMENDLKQMQLFVVPVTSGFLNTENQALQCELKVALSYHIPILPLMQEPGLAELFNLKCCNLHFLDPHQTEASSLGYEEKLKKYLESVLIGSELTEKIRAAFDAYIFLSYRKKDRKYAQELMKLIHKNDFCRDIAIWYDEFLTPGENFCDAIEAALRKSELFVMAVTPNLVNESNYIMSTEYPLAKEKGKNIFPVELIRTNKNKLARNFEGIPTPVDAYDEKQFSRALMEKISKIAVSEKNNTPEHSFFIGLAYLNGIDVEVDRERAFSLITAAAKQQLPEAMKKLSNMYRDGEAVTLDYKKAVYWAEQLHTYCKENLGEFHPDTLYSMMDLAAAYGAAGEYKKQEVCCERVYQYSSGILGEKHPDTLRAETDHAIALALCYDERDRKNPLLYRERAIWSGESAYLKYRDIYGEEHPDTIQALYNYGIALSNWKRYHNKTFSCFERVYQFRKNFFGEEHPDTMAALRKLAFAYGNFGNFQTQLELLEKVYAYYRVNFGEEHPVTVSAVFDLADCHFKMEHFRKGIELNVIVCELRRKLFGEEHAETKKAFWNIHCMYQYFEIHRGNDEAYEAVYEALCRLQGKTHIDTMRALRQIMIVYEREGNESKKKEYLDRFYKMKKEVLKMRRREKRRMLYKKWMKLEKNHEN